MKKKTLCVFAVILLCCVCAAAFGCKDGEPQEGGSETLDITAAEDYKLFMPKEGVRAGFIFYLGTAMDVDNYDSILTKVAESGIAVYVSSNPFPDLLYDEEEAAYDLLGLNKYFIGGHSQGGGAAVRRACENEDSTAGCILLSPLVSNSFTLADKDIPAIYFEAENDNVLSSGMQNNAKSRMNESCEFVLLQGAGHMCYGESSLLDGGGTVRDKAEIQAEVAEKIIAFINGVLAEH